MPPSTRSHDEDVAKTPPKKTTTTPSKAAKSAAKKEYKIYPVKNASEPSRVVPSTLYTRTFGCLQACVFSFVFLLSPLYMLTSLILPFFVKDGLKNPYLIAFLSPLLLSIIVPSTHSPAICKSLTAMLTYFKYREIHETSDEEILASFAKGKSYILACTPHGSVSFCGMCSAVYACDEFRQINTAVASVLLSTPILKHVLGIFGLIDASAKSLSKHFKNNKGAAGSIVIYVGGIAELFKSSRKEERLYLSGRKGFIKMAIREGVDVLPIYLMGNTSVLTVLKWGPLAEMSRKMQVSVTYFWGVAYTPIPRPDQMIYIRGRPLGLPQIDNPTDEDVNKWHAFYQEEVERLFNTYKGEHPMYKNKELYID